MRVPALRILLLAFACTLLLAPSASAWVRKENDRWTWYVPNSRWVESHSDNGIDVSSPTGVLYVGHGFGPTPAPVTHQEVVSFTRRQGALDLHPLRGVRFSRPGRRVSTRGIVRRGYRWRGYRTDRRERVRGLLTVDVMETAFSYGFSTYSRVAPASQFRRWDRRLAFIQRNIRLRPRPPDWGF